MRAQNEAYRLLLRRLQARIRPAEIRHVSPHPRSRAGRGIRHPRPHDGNRSDRAGAATPPRQRAGDVPFVFFVIDEIWELGKDAEMNHKLTPETRWVDFKKTRSLTPTEMAKRLKEAIDKHEQQNGVPQSLFKPGQSIMSHDEKPPQDPANWWKDDDNDDPTHAADWWKK